MLRFNSGVIYQLKVRTGRTTTLTSARGQIALYSGDDKIGDCVDRLEFPMSQLPGPYEQIPRTLRACQGDAVFQVSEVR